MNANSSAGFLATPQLWRGWKTTALGTPIDLVSCTHWSELTNHPEARNPILVMGGVHGDEPEGVRLAQDLLDWLQTQATNGKRLAPWVVIPCLNVDGFAKGNRVNARGVDLNRNYPSQDWSPRFDKDRYFPGPAPNSEPEIQGVVELIRLLRPRLIIHCHSWQPCIVGTGFRAEKDALRLASSSGYKAVEEIGYPTPGSLSRYGWHDLRIPVICIEEQEGLDDLSSIWPRFESGMEAIFTDFSLRSEAESAKEDPL
jgi:murein peptide amidase A